MRALLIALLLTACGDNEPPTNFPPFGVDAGTTDAPADALDVDAAADPCCSSAPPASCYPPPGVCVDYVCGAGFCTPALADAGADAGCEHHHHND